jgi:hypothetical protein
MKSFREPGLTRASGFADQGTEEDADPLCRTLLHRHLAAAMETWRLLQRNGVDEYSELTLNFFYETPEEEKALALLTHLKAETDYELDIACKGFLRKRWRVSGTTPASSLTLNLLNDWVRHMVLAGARFGCGFLGWSAGLP